MNLVIFLLGGVFGVPFLQKAHGYSLLDASFIVSALFVGLIIGNIIFGKLSECFDNKRKPPMIIGALCGIGTTLSIVLVSNVSTNSMMIFFGLCGMASGCQVLSYPVVAESNPPSLTATASSLSAMLLVAGGVVAQLYAVLLNWHDGFSSVLTSADFRCANTLLLLANVLALFCAMRIKETRTHLDSSI